MVTQRAELANLVTTVQGADTVSKSETSLTESFQSYIAGKNDTDYRNSDTGIQSSGNVTTEYNHKEAYDKISTGTYSRNVNQVKEKMQQMNDASQGQDVNDNAGLMPEDVQAIESDIRGIIKNNMDMTDEEIDEVLATMNVSVFQLLQPDTLQEFLVTQTGAEPIDMLTNGDLIQVLQSMNQEMSMLVDNYENLDTEQLIEVAQNVLEQLDTGAYAEENSGVHADVDVGVELAPEQVTVPEEDSVHANRDDKETSVQVDQKEEYSATDESTGIQVTVQNADTKKEQTNHHSFEQQGHQGQQIAGDVVNQLSQAVGEVGESVTSYTSELEQQDIVRQVVEQIKVWNGNETSRMQVQLYPEHLGRVEIQVMLKNGTMTAQITAETEMAKAAIESQLQILKESFEEKSIQVDAVEVSVGTPDFRDEQQRQDSTENNQDSRTHRARHRQGIFLDSSDEEEQDTNERLEAQGASVEFTA